MTVDQRAELVLAAFRSGAVPEGDYFKVLYILGLVKSGPADHVIDLEDEKVLTNLIINWAHLIDPEELTAVMSALRDCEDDVRRNDIIDMIIRKAFEYSMACSITEAEWRKLYECRLPKK